MPLRTGARPLLRHTSFNVTLVSLEEYLRTSYSPDREYRGGVLVERHAGDKEHSRFQARLARYIGRRRKQWNIEVYAESRCSM